MEGSKGYEQKDFEWAVKLNRISLQVVGLWPSTEHTQQEHSKNILRVLIAFLLLSLGVVFPYTHSLIKMHSNLGIIIEHIRYILPTLAGVVRLLTVWWKKEVVRSLLDIMAEDWMQFQNQKEKQAMIIWAKRARIIVTCGYSVAAVACTSIVLLPVFGISMADTRDSFKSDKLLPLEVYQSYGLTKWPQYELTYFLHIIILSCGAVTFSGIDNLLGLLVFHVCGQYDVLRIRLICLNKLLNVHDLKGCVIKHIRLLRAVAMIEELYNLILLAVFINSAVLFALYGFLILSLLEDRNGIVITQMLQLTNTAQAYLIYMALYCAVGEILASQCDKAYYALCKVRWYYLEPKKGKELILCLLKFKEPINITAGKIFPMTMITFSSIIKTSTGYISVLLAATH